MNTQRRTSNLANIVQYDTAGNVTLPASVTLGTAPNSTDDSLRVPSTSWVRALITSQNYITGNL